MHAMRLTSLGLLITLLTPCLSHASPVQTKPITISPGLIKKVSSLSPNSSNAHDIEVLLGSPAACLPLSMEAWACQWKGDLTRSDIRNTLNVTFESGMVTSVVGVDKKGRFLTPSDGKKHP